MKLTYCQKEAIAEALDGFEMLSQSAIEEIASTCRVNGLPDDALVAFLKAANAAYRAGEPIIEDVVYDQVFRAELEVRQPGHPFLHEVEAEIPKGKTVDLPARMLSTQKAYTKKELQTWLERVEGAASVFEISDPKIKAMPKLDGFAAYDDGTRLYSRGDGKKGTDITRVLERGMRIGGDGVRGQGAGEIVVDRTYFQIHMAEIFDNSRNVQAAILADKKVDSVIQKAIDDGAAVFMPFAQLSHCMLSPSEVVARVEPLLDYYKHSIPFDLDGLVLEAIDSQIRESMGSARSYHRWQIAYKVNEEGVPAVVFDVVPNTSRLGRVNPVAHIEPIRVSGVMISRVTAHHYGMVRSCGIGRGARIKIVRSGLVIPKIVGIIEAVEPMIPAECPSCSASLFWEGDYLFCRNFEGCPAQTSNSLEHFFKTMKNIDGFGPQTIEQLYRHGVRTVLEVYRLTHERLKDAGFGDKTSENLLRQLEASRLIPVEDSRFLAAFGVARLGEGNAEKLLAEFSLDRAFDVTAAEVSAIPGFAETTAQAIVSGLADIKEEFYQVLALGFNLIRSPLRGQKPISGNPIFGKSIVFTGKMQRGRDELEKQAKSLGAKVSSSVSSKTWLLVTGKDVGSAKTKAASDNGVLVMSEDQYLQLISGG